MKRTINPAIAIVPIRDANWFAVCLLSIVSAVNVSAVNVFAEEASVKADRADLHEPVFRVANQPSLSPVKNEDTNPAAITTAPEIEHPKEHPLDPTLVLAREILQNINENVRDYTCLIVKRERVNGELLEHEFMNCKIRHANEDGEKKIPFSVYLDFRKPDALRGREVIYVKGHNEGKAIAHEGGFKGRIIPTIHLVPNSALAMRGQRYPITDIGLKNLAVKLIEKGERDKKLGTCKVRMLKGARVKKRVCTCIEVTHPERLGHLDFHKARIFIDDELRLPIRYEAYDWPAREGERPQLLEEYTYLRLKLNVGLTDEDFSEKNASYNF